MLQSLSHCGNTNRIENLAGETADQDALRLAFSNAPALEVKNGIRVHLPDRRAVETAYVIVSNFELRLGVDLSLLREQQVFAVLDGVRLLSILVNHDRAIEHTFPIPGEHALVEFAAGRVGTEMIDARVIVHKPLSIHDEQPVQRAVCAFTIERDIQVIAYQRSAK